MMEQLPLKGFTIRPATVNDLKQVCRLMVRQNVADYGEPAISEDQLLDSWQNERFDLANDTWLVVAPDGYPAGYAELRQSAPDQFYFSMYLAEGYPGSEIGAQLLQNVEHRAATLHENHNPIDLTSRVSERNQIVKQVFEKADYVSDLSFLIMETVMKEPPDTARWAVGITVRPFMVGQDDEATYRADEEASEDKGYHQPLTFEAWARRMNLHGAGFDPALWFLACERDEVAGVALNVYSQETNVGWVDHLGVRRQWRNQGIGMNLLLHSFEAFYQRGVNTVKLSVDSRSLTNAPRLYERAGMRTIQQYHVYRKTLKFNN